MSDPGGAASSDQPPGAAGSLTFLLPGGLIGDLGRPLVAAPTPGVTETLSRGPGPEPRLIEEFVMSVIKPRTRGKHFVEHRTRLERENHETLYAYAAFLEEEPEYVLNQLIETLLAKDRDFVGWRATHPQSYAPQRFVKTPRVGAHHQPPQSSLAIGSDNGSPSPQRAR